jgi:hypothetical protein
MFSPLYSLKESCWNVYDNLEPSRLSRGFLDSLLNLYTNPNVICDKLEEIIQSEMIFDIHR